MSDYRIDRLAKVLVHYSTAVKPRQWAIITGTTETLPLVRAVYREVVKAGGYPDVVFTDEYNTRTMLREGSDDQLDWVSPMNRAIFEDADVFINLRSSSNTRAMTNIDSLRQQRVQRARTDIMQTYLRRDAEGTFAWVLTQYPTEAFAQEANMSLEEYADFVYGATFADREDPVAEWQKMHDLQQSKVDYLAGKKRVKCIGPNIDIELSIEGRTFINDDGHKNLPGGEIFTGPVEDSVNGWVRFSYPSIVSGKAVSGIELKFEQGKVVEAKAEQNDDLLQAQLNTDAGARYLGEFAIGTNFGIQKFTGNILFDEKIGGTIHMAIGKSYPTTGGKNNSAVHWDMICDMRNDSEIHIDGELFYKNGQFVG